MLKIGFPEEESEHEHLVLQRWGGNGAVRLLSADPHHRRLLLERLRSTDLSTVSDVEACIVVADLYRAFMFPRYRNCVRCRCMSIGGPPTGR